METTVNDESPQSFGARQLIALSVYAFALSYLWNSLGPIVLPQLVERVAPPGLTGTYLGLLRFLGLWIAIIVQPMAGSLSDRSTSRFGRRRPFVFVGTLGDLVFLIALALAGNYVWLVLAYCLLQFTSNVAHGPYLGFIPDLVPENRRGTAAGIKSLVEVTAMILASKLVAQLMGEGRASLAFASIAAVLLITLAITLLTVRETPLAAEASPAVGSSVPILLALTQSFKLDRQRDREYVLWLISRFLILLGVQFVQTYGYLYVAHVIRPANPSALVGDLLAVIGISILLSAYPAGLWADRVSHKLPNILAGFLGAAGVSLLVLTQGATWTQASDLILTDVLLAGVLIGLAMGVFLSTNWALAIDLIPRHEGARYLGISNLSTAGAGLGAGLIGGPLLDLFGFGPLFVVAILSLVSGAVLLFAVKEPVRSEAKRHP